MKIGHFHRLFFLFYVVSTLLGTTTKGQEGWTGDLGMFVFDHGLLRPAGGDTSGEGLIRKDFSSVYASGADKGLYWRTTARFSDRPSALNRFEWTLFSVQKRNGEVLRYTLSPDRDGRHIELAVDTYDGAKSVEKTSTEYLESLEVLHPSTGWQDLVIEAFLKSGDGLTFRIAPSGQKPQVSYAYPPESGQFLPEIRFYAKFSPLKKAAYSWSIPFVGVLSEKLPPLEYTKVSVTDEGIVLIRLNKPVSIEGAVVRAPGLEPSLSAPEPDLLSVRLGSPPKGVGEFVIEIVGLRDESGSVETLEVRLEAYSDTEPSAGQSGIFLSEVMVDPPASGPLRGLKYIEIYNGTDGPVSPSSLILAYRTRTYALTGETIPAGGYGLVLPPGLVLTIPGAKIYLDDFPALSGDFLLKLLDAGSGASIDSYYFSARSYEPGAPKSGFSIERVSFAPPRWRSSTASDGGTPGKATAMKPFGRVPKGGILLSELFLSPKNKKERYIEVYNDTVDPVTLSDLYLTHRSTPSAPFTPVRLAARETVVAPKGYLVLAADTAAFFKSFPDADRALVFEKSDFPDIDTDHAELALRAYRDDALIDRGLFRKVWTGAKEAAIERFLPAKDGTLTSSWGVSAGRGTPGKAGVPLAVAQSETEEDPTAWPEDPVLTFERLTALLPLHLERASLRVSTVVGQTLIEAKGADAARFLDKLKRGTAPLPSAPLLIRVTIHHPNEDASSPESTPPLTYTSVWQHLKR